MYRAEATSCYLARKGQTRPTSLRCIHLSPTFHEAVFVGIFSNKPGAVADLQGNSTAKSLDGLFTNASYTDPQALRVKTGRILQQKLFLMSKLPPLCMWQRIRMVKTSSHCALSPHLGKDRAAASNTDRNANQTRSVCKGAERFRREEDLSVTLACKASWPLVKGRAVKQTTAWFSGKYVGSNFLTHNWHIIFSEAYFLIGKRQAIRHNLFLVTRSPAGTDRANLVLPMATMAAVTSCSHLARHPVTLLLILSTMPSTYIMH